MNNPRTNYNANKSYWVTGKLLNELGKLIAERTPSAGAGLESVERPDGVTLSTSQGGGGDVIVLPDPDDISKKWVWGYTPGEGQGWIEVGCE